jgi:hypothetical protein
MKDSRERKLDGQKKDVERSCVHQSTVDMWFNTACLSE